MHDAPQKSRPRALDVGGKPFAGAIFVSAFVYPGMGQFLQKRYVAGTLFVTTFSVALLLFLIYALGGIIFKYYRLIDFSVQVDADIPLREMLICFAAGFILWILNVFDAWRFHRRQARAYRERRLQRGSQHTSIDKDKEGF